MAAAGLAACAGAGQGAAPGDREPPRFGGVVSATTCAPGPRAGTVSIRLDWRPAADEVTAPAAIRYEIYRSRKAGGQDFSRPSYTTGVGASSFVTPPLAGDELWYFVVRARDRAGNRDQNRVERVGENLCA